MPDVVQCAGLPSARRFVTALAERYGLSAEPLAQLHAFLDLLASDPHAPTAVRDPVKVAEDHLADALVALELEELHTATTIADLGAGAGIPGLPLAFALPAKVSLVESSARKCAFLTRAVAVCAAVNADVVHSRAESWAPGLHTCDVVTARALAPLAVLAEYAAPLLRTGGSLVAWRGQRDPDAETEAARAALELGLEPQEPRRVRPYEKAEHRHLHVMLKVGETPDVFPRRAGMARKRPLGRRR